MKTYQTKAIKTADQMINDIIEHEYSMEKLRCLFHNSIRHLELEDCKPVFDSISHHLRLYWGKVKPSLILGDFAKAFPNDAHGGKLFRALSKQLHEEVCGEYLPKHKKMTSSVQQDKQGSSQGKGNAGTSKKSAKDKAMTEFSRIQKLPSDVKAELLELLFNEVTCK